VEDRAIKGVERREGREVADSLPGVSHGSAPDDVVDTHEQAATNAREPLVVLEPLRAFLDVNEVGSGALSAEPIGDGHSNVTYLLRRDDGTEVVLRRPPRGPLPPSAHDVLREARLLRALAPTPARVPAVLAVGDDEAIIGVPFYVMEKVDGFVVTGEIPAPLDTIDDRRRMGEELIDALVEMHSVDWRAAGLEGFGRESGYLERQLRRWGGLWEHNRTREVPAVERVGTWLAANLPQSPPATIVHGDYRLGNVMLGPSSPTRLVAIFDWEMATIGDPLADLGYLTTMWPEHDDPATRVELSTVTRQPGFLTRDELIARYEERSGRAMTDIRWYRTLAVWKAIVFMEGNYRRAVSGTTDDPYLKAFGEGVLELADRAEAIAFA
jgi:aminoglycoside phosphotransferase (APT) family kinase protein